MSSGTSVPGTGFGGGAPSQAGWETIGGLGVDSPPPDAPDPTESGKAAADRLQGIIERATSWPIWSADHAGGVDTGTYSQVGMYGRSMRDIALWQAFREHDREQLVSLTGWERDRPLHVDPLPERISDAYRQLLFGEEPDYHAAAEADQDTLEEMVDEVGLSDELSRWTDIFVSEGEVWWRAWTDRDTSDWPIVAGHSRTNVIPLFVGRKIVAVAFVDVLFTQEIRWENQVTVQYYRHIEIQATGYVRNLLYKGTLAGLGGRVPLTDAVETEGLDEDWEHGLPCMLAGRIPYKVGRDFRLGTSVYQGVRDLLMDLNEARTIMAENARLVLKARMVVPANAVDSQGNFDAGKDVVIQESLDEEMSGKPGGPYTVLEYNFRADQLISYVEKLVLDIMTRCGLAEQFTQGSNRGEGQAFTGTALRTRLIPTLQAAKTVAKGPDKEVPKILKALAMLSALPEEKGGCNQSWSEPDGKHTYKRATMLPEDINEQYQRHVMGVQGEIESVRTAVEDIHPDWTDDEIEEEVDRIAADRSAGPTYDAEALEKEQQEQLEQQAAGGDPHIPNVPPGGPGSAVPTPQDVVGSRQPGVQGKPPVDGRNPGQQPPQVPGGGPR